MEKENWKKRILICNTLLSTIVDGNSIACDYDNCKCIDDTPFISEKRHKLEIKKAVKNLTKHNNDFKKDWRIKAIQKANSNKEVNRRTLKDLKEYRQSIPKS